MSKESPRVGEWIEVRSKEEILATLDADGRLDGMPFMPEMFEYCGRRFQVEKSAHKTCDTVFPIRSRRLDQSVHLPTRCDGSAHGGCQAGCLIFWKNAWLRPAGAELHEGAAEAGNLLDRAEVPRGVLGAACTEATVNGAARIAPSNDDPIGRFVCQATQLPYFTKDLNPYDPRQYLMDIQSGNVGLGQWLSGLVYITYRNMIQLGIGWGPLLRWIYERFQRLRGGVPYPRRSGMIPMGQPTPAGRLDLSEGEWVRVRSYEEILATCNAENRNRGLFFDAEQVPFCGGTYRVAKRVSRIIHEGTGHMMHFENPCIILENVACLGRYSDCRMFCPRAIYAYWREVWLERIESHQNNPPGLSAGPAKRGIQ